MAIDECNDLQQLKSSELEHFRMLIYYASAVSSQSRERVYCIPGGCTSKLLPVDMFLNKPIKDIVQGHWEGQHVNQDDGSTAPSVSRWYCCHASRRCKIHVKNIPYESALKTCLCFNDSSEKSNGCFLHSGSNVLKWWYICCTRVALHTIKYVCPALETMLMNCYQSLIRLAVSDGGEILLKEGQHRAIC